MSSSIRDGATDLYRFFDADGRLLYVGISFSAVARASQHRGEKPWWPEVANMTVERHDTRDAAAEAELAAILSEKPIHNVVGNRGSIPKPRKPIHSETGDAVYHAVLRLMSASETPSPWAYQDIVAAVQQGVHDAVAEHLDNYGLVQS